MNAFFHFHGDLTNLLRRRWRGATPIIQPVTRSASIKDVIESFGVPHTEVGEILCDGLPVQFPDSWRPVDASTSSRSLSPGR